MRWQILLLAAPGILGACESSQVQVDVAEKRMSSVHLRIESVTASPAQVSILFPRSGVYQPGDSPKKRLVVTTPARVIVPRTLDSVQIQVAQPPAVQIVFDSGATPEELGRNPITGSDILFVRRATGFETAVQMRQQR
jgi:hypothetical protein